MEGIDVSVQTGVEEVPVHREQAGGYRRAGEGHRPSHLDPDRARVGRMGLSHLSLKTRDLRGTERFYTELLGLRVAFRHRGMVFLRSPRSRDVLDFCRASRAFDPAAGGLDHFGLQVDRRRFRALRQRLSRAGVKVVGRRGHWAIYVKDPNGYTVELYAD